MKKHTPSFLLVSGILILGLTACKPRYTIETQDGFNMALNKGGQSLGYTSESGVNILTVNRLAFKDLNKNGVL